VVGIDQYTKWNDEFFPALRDKPSIGLPPMPNYEKIIHLNPQVVIAFADPLFCYPTLENKLELTGIKVVRLNFHDPETYDREVNMLGQMLSKEKRAEEFLDFSRSWVNNIEERVEDIPLEERIRVYYEWIAPYSTYGEGAGPSRLITMAGGINISNELKMAGSYSPFPLAPTAGFFSLMSPESVVEKNPQVILKDLMNLSDIMGGHMAPKTIGYTRRKTDGKGEE
jgi:iron complex transport system substrate-binding protein